MGIYSPDGDVDSYGAEEVNLRNSSGVELLGQKVQAASLPVTIASDQSTLPAKIVNTTTGNQLAIETNGSIKVIPLETPPAPSGALSVINTAFGIVASVAGSDTYYTITNGKILTVQTLLAGAEATTGGSIVELFYDPNANLTGMTRISTIFIDGASDNAPVYQDFTGNGTRRMVLRRRGYTSAGREMFAQWIGYEV